MLYVDKAGESPLLGDLSRIRACLQSGHQQINYDAAGRYPAAKPVLSSLIDGLVDEQRGLCVYCTRRIAGHMTERLPLSRILGPDDMDRPVDAHVEHYVPRHPGPWYTGKGRTSAARCRWTIAICLRYVMARAALATSPVATRGFGWILGIRPISGPFRTRSVAIPRVKRGACGPVTSASRAMSTRC